MSEKLTFGSALKAYETETGRSARELYADTAREIDTSDGIGPVAEIMMRNTLKEAGIQFDEDGVELPPPPKPEPAAIPYPPGVAGLAARWLAGGNLAPNPLASIASVLAAPAAICGRAWTNDSPQREDGVNVYLCLLAPSGSGKEWMWGGLRHMLSVAGLRARGGVIASRPASGSALSEMLEDSPCCVVPLQEAGKYLQRILGRNANGADISLQQDILSLYNESGASDVHVGTAKAGRKGTAPVIAPCLSLLGDSTHSSLWAALSDDSARSGLLSRLVVLDAGEGRPRPLATARLGECPAIVREALGMLADQRNDALVDDPYGRRRIAWSPEACEASARRFEAWAEGYQRADEFEALLTSRCRQNAPRIAAALALWDDPAEPTVTAPHIDWAWDLVIAGAARLVAAYRGGEIIDARVDLDAIVLEYARGKASDGVIRRNNLRAWAAHAPAFASITGDQLGRVVDSVLASLEASGSIALLSENDRKDRGIRGRAYVVAV